MTVASISASIPSPEQGVWSLGPLPIRAYALLIVLGIIVAVWWGNRRYVARGGEASVITDIAIWAVPFGIVGGRLYHVISDNQLYFGPDGAGWMAALRIWDGGLGIWGAVAFGALGAWIGARRAGVLLPPVGDAIAPGIVVAQAIGRWGNWFNQELFGAPDRAALGPGDRRDPPPVRVRGVRHLPPDVPVRVPAGSSASPWSSSGPTGGSRWATAGSSPCTCSSTAAAGSGSRPCGSTRRTPSSGLRLNVWTALVVGIGALAYLVISSRMRPGRETVLTRADRTPQVEQPPVG